MTPPSDDTARSRSPLTVRIEAGVGLVIVDNAPVNALNAKLRAALIEAFTGLASDPYVAAIVLTGTGTHFLAGADLREMSLPPIPPSLPEVILAMEACGKPIVAAINGPALGGGYEVALACDFRLAAPAGLVGLPEVRLGINPGSGGTQRLPRLVGIPKAIELIASAKILKAPEAAALGMIDDMAADVVEQAIARAKTTAKRRLSELPVPAAAPQEIDAAIERVGRRARGNAAIPVAVELIKQSAHVPIAEALVAERAEFMRLRETDEAKALRHLFFAEREAQKVDRGSAKARDVKGVAIVGGGTMGSGIAVSFADAGFPVVLVERDADAAAAAVRRIDGIYAGQVRGGRLDEASAAHRRVRIAVSANWDDIGNADLVIEAVFEDLALKTDVFRRLDRIARPGAILATNTSYLDVDVIAAATVRPQDVVGLHFFSPANVMRLLEVVHAARTAPDVLATAFSIAKRIGKLPVVAGVCDGFIGNRIFAVYRREAEYLIEDGAAPEEIDRAIERYGFALGPFATADLAGLDIGWATRKRRAATRPASERYVDIPDRICERGWFGRKTGRGWYLYNDGSTRPAPNPEVAAIIAAERARKGIVPRAFSDDEIVRRLLGMMANEGAKVLAEGIAQRASDIDLVFANGYGFPGTRGGPMFAADLRGLPNVLRDVEATGAEPAPLLRELAAAGKGFAQWDEKRRGQSPRPAER